MMHYVAMVRFMIYINCTISILLAHGSVAPCIYRIPDLKLGAIVQLIQIRKDDILLYLGVGKAK